ncbi:MAG: type II secretion system minor pseudopilin GspI [Candidatus Thiodiazotropha sp.]
MQQRCASEGMTLIEVLVAFVILAMTMSVVLRINSGAIRNHQVASDYLEAVSIADARMQQMSVEVSGSEARREGEETGGYRWFYERHSNPNGMDEKRLAVPATPYEEQLEVRWDSPAGERRLVFTRQGMAYGNH